MRPAFSVIFLTTLIGAGQGLFLALFTVQSYAGFGLLPEQPGAFYSVGGVLALALLAGGLAASFFHLGRPERAWRAATQWRTSWLSREVLVLPAFMGVVSLYTLAHALNWHPVLLTLPTGLPVDPTAVLGVVGTALAFLLYLCTAMIYACLRFLREWHTPLTVINYVLLGGSSGFTAAAALAVVWAPGVARFFVGWSLILLLLAMIGRLASLVRNRRLRPKSTPQSAIGIKHPVIVQKTQGATGGSFNTREFFHGRSAAELGKARGFFLIAVFLVPGVLLALAFATQAPALPALSFLVMSVGLLVERWMFFAEANHPQNIYYRSVA